MKTLPLLRALLLPLAAFFVVHTATAQTSTDPNEGSRLTYDSELGSYDLSWWGQPGRTYFFQHSDDLLNWEYLPLIESGTDGVLTWGFTSTSSTFFLRLRTADIPTSDPFADDFDYDKVSNYEEVVLGTDPLSGGDSDTNGLPDDWEKFYFGHLGVDPNATAPGGGMTNLQHFAMGSNPNNPPPPPLITAGTAALDQNANTLLYPADDSQLLLQNGNFSATALGSDDWNKFSGIAGWTAISGSLIELQQIEVNTAAGAGQYCELDSHWATENHSGDSDHGIQQTVNLARGHYVLIFDYRGRSADAASFTVKLKNAGSSEEVILATKNAASTTSWQRASTTFEISGGNPNSTTLATTLLFDIADAGPDSYGAYIDNVILLPLEVLQPRLDTNGNVVQKANGEDELDPVSAIRFTRWTDAFTFPQSVFIPGFESTDKDRFYVKIAWPQSQTISLRVGVRDIANLSSSVTEEIFSTQSLLPVLGTNQHKTSGLLLVADSGDSTSYHGVGIGADRQIDDVTHLASLGAKVRLQLSGIGDNIEVNVPVVKPQGKVKINIYVMSQAANLLPAELSDVVQDFLVAKEIYAQIGIRLELGAIKGAPTGPTIDGLIADGNLTPDFPDPMGEQLRLMSSLSDTTKLTEIPVVYLRATMHSPDWPANGSFRVKGITASSTSTSAGAIVVSMPDRSRNTLAHEIGHSLGLPHAIEGTLVRHLLMTDQGIVYTEPNGNKHDSKRFTLGQETTIKAGRKFYVPIP